MGRTRRTAFVLFALAISTASVRAGYAPGCTVALEILGAVAHEANAVTIQPDGKIVVAGYADLGLGAGRDFLVARFHPDLSLDTSFNGTGYRVDDFPYVRDDEAFAVVVQFDQKIVVGGYTKQTPAKHYFAFARYTRDGSLDASFGAGGFRAIDFPSSSSDQLRGMAIQPDGKILGAGFWTQSGNPRLGVVRLLKNGDLDDLSAGFPPEFDVDGAAQPTIAGSAFSLGTDVVVQPDGKIVVSGEAGFATSDFIAVRLNPNGSLDNTFSTNGWVSTDIGSNTSDSASSLVLQSDEKIVLAGTAGTDVAVVRYDKDGNIDATFGSGGKVVHNFGGSDTGNALALDSGGNLLVAGTSSLATANFAFARFLLNGTNNLSQTDDVSGFEDRGFGIAVTRVGKILVVGSSQGPATPKTTLALYLPDGSQDCGPPVYPVDVFTAGSSGDSTNGGQVMLNWLNPSYGPYDRTVIRRATVSCPATHNDGVPVATQSNGLGAPGGFVDTVPLGSTYHYAAFVLDSLSQPSTRVCRSATPFDRNAGAVKVEWLYDTSSSALTTPGLRVNVSLNESVVYTVANDLVHAIRGGLAASGGGSWPPGWRPFLIGGPVQGRPPVVPLPAPWSTRAVLLGSQDGRAYAVNAFTGALIWRSAVLGTNVQAALAAVLTALGGTADLVFVATRNPGQPNGLYALDATDGAVVWYFDNAPTRGIGEIVSGASVDYAAHRVYFTSALGTSGKTTWCLDYSGTPPAMCSGWTAFGVRPGGGGDIEASPILYQNLLFVSDTSPGYLYAVTPADGLDSLVFNLADGGAKGFVFPQFGTTKLFASTSTSTWSVDYSSGFPDWTGSCVATPSTPTAVRGTDWVFVGSGEGKLFQYSASSGGGGCPASRSACIGNCVSTIVGAPAYDVLRTMLYAGTDEGKIYGVRAPFQP